MRPNKNPWNKYGEKRGCFVSFTEEAEPILCEISCRRSKYFFFYSELSIRRSSHADNNRCEEGEKWEKMDVACQPFSENMSNIQEALKKIHIYIFNFSTRQISQEPKLIYRESALKKEVFSKMCRLVFLHLKIFLIGNLCQKNFLPVARGNVWLFWPVIFLTFLCEMYCSRKKMFCCDTCTEGK